MERTLRRPQVWDCGSTLYDSFELKSFERQLSLAINSRTLSMPHLEDKSIPKLSTTNPPTVPKKPPNKISRSIHKLLKSVFKSKHDRTLQAVQELHVSFDNSGALPTIPEAPREVEIGGFSPEFSSLNMTRAASQRFTSTSIGVISCA